MLGAIAGDIIGSIYEHDNIKTKEFPLFGPTSRFTDDSVMTLAVAEALLSSRSFAETLRDFALRYPDRGYGQRFRSWVETADESLSGSWGNGAVMRVSPVAYAGRSEDEVLALARDQATPSHGHPDAVTGAQTVALAIWLVRQGESRDALRDILTGRFGLNLERRVDDIRPGHGFDVSARGTVPTAIICALEADDYEDAVRNAVSLGGDSDTLACIAGSLAEALYGLPPAIANEALTRLDLPLRQVVTRFDARHGR